MLARAITHALVGLEPQKVEVEAHVRDGAPSFTIVGLADRACQEAKARVASAVRSAELHWPDGRLVVNDRRDLYPDILDAAGLRLEERLRRHVNRRTGRRAGEFYEDVLIARA